MEVFISWSGKLSKRVAKILKKWLEESVFPDENISAFVSEADIDSGVDWLGEIKSRLLNSDCGIVVLTKDNISAPWLNFESGSVAVSKEERKAIPFLVNISKSEIQSPLKHFQAVSIDKESIMKFISDLKKFGDFGSPSHIDDSIDRLFEELSVSVAEGEKDILGDYLYDQFVIYPEKVRGVKKGKVFVGVPMASAGEKEYTTYKECALKVKKAILEHAGAKEVYCPCEAIPDSGRFDGYKKAIYEDFKILKESEHYVFIYPEKLASSILVEMGYAIALSKNTTIFAKSISQLPFMLRRADSVLSNIEIHKYQEDDDIVRIIERENSAFLVREN